eukprot:103530_1
MAKTIYLLSLLISAAFINVAQGGKAKRKSKQAIPEEPVVTNVPAGVSTTVIQSDQEGSCDCDSRAYHVQLSTDPSYSGPGPDDSSDTDSVYCYDYVIWRYRDTTDSCTDQSLNSITLSHDSLQPGCSDTECSSYVSLISELACSGAGCTVELASDGIRVDFGLPLGGDDTANVSFCALVHATATEDPHPMIPGSLLFEDGQANTYKCTVYGEEHSFFFPKICQKETTSPGNCDEQLSCIHVSVEPTGTNMEYEVCLWWNNDNPACQKDDEISHMCANRVGHKLEGWNVNVPQCKTVPCGSEWADFGIKDSTSCETEAFLNTQVDTVTAKCIHETTDGPTETDGYCASGQKGQCTWWFEIPECLSPDPTIDPTVAPTKDPTDAPTTDPTRDPTNDPTIDPTKFPTEDPTDWPTWHPTDDPTIDPTSDPTLKPTKSPFQSPCDYLSDMSKLDVMILVDKSCQLLSDDDGAYCVERQKMIAELMTSIKGEDTRSADDILSRVG